MNKKLVIIFIICLVCFITLSACNDNVPDYAMATISAKITKIQGDFITVSLGEYDGGNTYIYYDTAETETQESSVTEEPKTEQGSSESGNATVEKQTIINAENRFVESDISYKIDISSANVYTRGIEIDKDNLNVNSIVYITFDKEGNVAKIYLIETIYE